MMEQIMNYVQPELIVVAIVLYFCGMGLKQTQAIKDKYIPLILGAGGIVLCGIWVMATCPLGSGQEIALAIFTAIVQGILMAGLSTYVNQIIKQAKKDEEYTIPQGHHDGSGKVGISAAEKEKIIPDNIREGITLLGVEGSMLGTEDAKPQAKTVTPSTKEQTVLPDSEEGYNYLSQVTVKAIPYNESKNPAGGTTVTIG